VGSKEGLAVGAAPEVEKSELAWMKLLKNLSESRKALPGWRDKSGQELDEYLREVGVFRIKTLNDE